MPSSKQAANFSLPIPSPALGRTTKGLIDLVELLKERGIGFKSLQDNIDTSTPMGQFFFVVFSAIAELERSMIRECSKAGLAAARARKGGRPFALKGQDRVDAMLLIENGRPTQYIMEKFKVSRSTADRNWKQWKSEKELSADKKSKPKREAAGEEIRA